MLLFASMILYFCLILLPCPSLIGLGQGNTGRQEIDAAMEEKLNPNPLNPIVESDDERPESFDDKLRKKEMRRGIDLATTLERIEKNFVITDPRLPDNPIVRSLKCSFGSFLLFVTFCN